jgi:sugar lactone lactonase YvrE
MRRFQLKQISASFRRWGNAIGLGFALLASFTFVCSRGQAALLGDVDGDARVTANDAVRLLEGVMGLRNPTSRERLLGDVWPSHADPRIISRIWTLGDGVVDTADVMDTLRTAIGLVPARDIGPVVYDVAGSGRPFVQSVSAAMESNPKGVGDGPAEEITLFAPYDLAIAPNGNVYFTENDTSRIRALTPDGMVRTVAGGLTRGYVDGKGAKALFNLPMGLALLPNGDLVVADCWNHVIRKVTLDGEVTTLAGTGFMGNANGIATKASFNSPNGVATDPAGNVYVADTGNNLIRKITPDGKVTTLAGQGDIGLLDGYGTKCLFNKPTGVTYDPRDGGLYIADMSNQSIRKYSGQDGYVVTVAGLRIQGAVDGSGSNARFSLPYAVDLDSQGNVWVADWGNGLVRVMDQNNKVKTMAGNPPDGGYMQGPASAMHFAGLMSVRRAPNGLIYVTPSDSQRIQVYAP